MPNLHLTIDQTDRDILSELADKVEMTTEDLAAQILSAAIAMELAVASEEDAATHAILCDWLPHGKPN